MTYAVDLFAGIGGWEIPLEARGYNVIGLDNAKWPNLTRFKAGFTVLEADISTVEPLEYPKASYNALVGSPPCPSFSQATKGTGIKDPRGKLVFAMQKWVEVNHPQWIAMEQVRGAKPYFEQIADWLHQRHGYFTWVGMLNAAAYGVPQARKRCLLIASKSHPVDAPPATVERHVTMAEALPHRTDLPDWAHERPSMTVVGSFRPEVIAAPGWRKKGDPSRQDTPNSVVTTINERLVLQGFPPDYPVQGKKTAQGLQVGNAIPPALADAAIRMCIEGIPYD